MNRLHPSALMHMLPSTPLHPKVASKIDFQLAQMFNSPLFCKQFLCTAPETLLSTNYSVSS